MLDGPICLKNNCSTAVITNPREVKLLRHAKRKMLYNFQLHVISFHVEQKCLSGETMPLQLWQL